MSSVRNSLNGRQTPAEMAVAKKAGNVMVARDDDELILQMQPFITNSSVILW